jgi:hypothetical protein
MSPSLVDIGAIVAGVLLVAGSRVFADAFRIPDDTSLATKFMGLGDNYSSRLYRWTIAVLVGLMFIGAGLADLLGS